MLHMDNGPEFISLSLAEWAKNHTVKLEVIHPDKPTQNAERSAGNHGKWLPEYNCESPA